MHTKKNGEEIVKELSNLRDEMAEGRREDTEGISSQQAPFFDLLKSNLGIENDVSINELIDLTHLVVSLLSESATVSNFWNRQPEVRRMEGQIEDEIHYSKIDGLSSKAAELTSELMKLAKNREADLR